MTRDAWIYGLGLGGLGLVCLSFMSFALQWQPVPKALHEQSALIIISAGLLMVAAGLIIAPRTTRWGGWLAGALFLIWVVALHLPLAAASPSSVVVWLGVAEILALSLAGFLWAVTRERSRPRSVRLITAAFGVCALVFGLSHFVYLQFTATLVPGWLPFPLFWAYATGAGHALAGVALLAGRFARLAAGVHAAMCASFVLLVHAPRVMAAPESQAEWTGLMVAILISGAAWLIHSGLAAPSGTTKLGQHATAP